jgi:uncharacterized beta-barrel protein YwiB (DUF1934 family)
MDTQYKKDVIVKVESKFSDVHGSVYDNLEIVTKGVYLKENDIYRIKYIENDKNGFEGSEMSISLKGQDVLINRTGRSGKNRSNLYLQKGRRHHTLYPTEVGKTRLGVTADYINYNLGENGGNINLKYLLELDNRITTYTEVSMTIDVRN